MTTWLCLPLALGAATLAVVGLGACGGDSTTTVIERETKTKTETVTTEAAAEATTTTPTTTTPTDDAEGAAHDCPPGQIEVVATGMCVEERSDRTSGSGGASADAAADCPPGQIKVIATGECVKE